MEETLHKRVKAAAGAAWWTVLIFAVGLTVSWFAALCLIHTRPAFATWLMAGQSWETLSVIYVWMFGVLKLIVLTALMLAVWLSLWACRLRRYARQGR